MRRSRSLQEPCVPRRSRPEAKTVTHDPTGVVDDETDCFLSSQVMARIALAERTTTPVEDRIVDGLLESVARWGIAKTTVEDVARAAGVSRATVYRAFPGGKDVIFEAVVRRESARFLAAVTARLDAAETLEDAAVIGMAQAAPFLTR